MLDDPMVPWKLVDRAATPDRGVELTLHRRGDEFSIRVDGAEVMNSRQHGSEDALAELACKKISGRHAPRVLIGGLGMGFTLAAAARCLPADAALVVAELIPSVVDWNRAALAELAGRPLDDARVEVRVEDVAETLAAGQWDAIVLDVDHSPDSFIVRGNASLYAAEGLTSLRAALTPHGVLTVWSAAPSEAFTRRLKKAGFDSKTRAVRARGEGRGSRHTIWVARPR
jgi:spermidine synthase